MRKTIAFALLVWAAACTPTKPPVTNGDHDTHEPPPAADKRPVTDTYHGVEVTEDYRWLEDAESEDVQAWSDAQNTYARNYLAHLPGLEAIRSRVQEVLTADSTSWWSLEHAGDRLFAMSWKPPKQQPYLIVMDDVRDLSKQRVLVDPNVLQPDGLLSIDWYVPSPDGSMVAVSMSKQGTESGDVYFYETRSGRQVHEVIHRVNGGTAGGSLAWSLDGKGVYYSRYPRPGERKAEDLHFYVQIYFHRLGSDEKVDRYELGKNFPRVAEIELKAHHSNGQILATIQDGDGGEFSHYLRSRRGDWKQFSEFGDRTIQAEFGLDDSIYVLSRADAPRGKIVRISSKQLDVSKGRVIVPEGKDTIVDSFWSAPTILPTSDRLFVLYQLGGPSEIRAFTLDGKKASALKQLPVSSARGMTRVGDHVLFRNGSYIEPWTWLELDAASGTTTATALKTDPVVALEGVQVARTFATSKDGTKVPVNVLLPANSEGTTPMVVTGYGGYGINLSPYYSRSTALLLEAGVGVAIANLRGGGEYGEEWHRQGNLTNKQNVFDDFAAVLDHLVSEGITTPQQIVIEGGSNGGLLMGAALTQFPDKMKAVVSHVGIYDMLRVELSPNGEFNVTEFGTVKDEKQFQALLAYSPYHNVKEGTDYPPVLFLTGANDPRVDPMQSRKMTARLQAVSKAPVLLRTTQGGHGGSTSLDEKVSSLTDVLAFILDELDVTYDP